MRFPVVYTFYLFIAIPDILNFDIMNKLNDLLYKTEAYKLKCLK